MTDPRPLVLVVEDEAQMRRFIRVSLGNHDYRVVEADRGQLAIDMATSHNPDIVLLDLGLPDIDGLTVTQALRAWTQAPIVVISARGQDDDKIKALDAGADDYVTKPFSMGELLARMRVALRHAAQRGQDSGSVVVNIGELRVDLIARLVFVGDQEIHLTPNEYKLLVVLVKHAGKVLTHQQLLREVWGPKPRERHAVPARLHGPAPSQARKDAGAPAVSRDRAWRRIPAAERMTDAAASL